MSRLLPAALAIVFLVGEAWAQEKPPARRAFLDSRSAGEDFAIQGEYLGNLPTGERYGVQVIALGKERFRAVGYRGGLPGDGWDRSAVEAAEGSTRDGVTRIETERGHGEISAGTMRLFDPAGTPRGELKKILRESPTLGAKPPQGAIVLFDGKSADAWRGGRVIDGLLQVGPQSKQSFGDFALHLEFQTPFMPNARGQDRGNSGVFLQRRYEIQILDSFGLEGLDNECGGLYGFRKPDLNICFPPLSWQTYDVDFRGARFDETGKKTTNARMTVRHNGVLVHDNVEIPETSPSPFKFRESAGGGPLYLQYHGCPVRYRNIWVVAKG